MLFIQCDPEEEADIVAFKRQYSQTLVPIQSGYLVGPPEGRGHGREGVHLRYLALQIGRLVQLKELSLESRGPCGSTFILKQPYGCLDLLVNLKQLESILWKEQGLLNVKIQEADWILNHWPKLKLIQGEKKWFTTCNFPTYDYLKKKKPSLMIM